VCYLVQGICTFTRGERYGRKRGEEQGILRPEKEREKRRLNLRVGRIRRNGEPCDDCEYGGEKKGERVLRAAEFGPSRIFP